MQQSPVGHRAYGRRRPRPLSSPHSREPGAGTHKSNSTPWRCHYSPAQVPVAVKGHHPTVHDPTSPPAVATLATRLSFCLSLPLSKAAPPVFRLHAVVQEWKHMVSVRGEAPHGEEMANTQHGYSSDTSSTGRRQTDIYCCYQSEIVRSRLLKSCFRLNLNIASSRSQTGV